MNAANPSLLVLVEASLFAGPGSGGWVAGLAAGGGTEVFCFPFGILQDFSR